ncbi:IS200/IS605 family transposase [Candidatus Peregrinibacteria bacterium]|nr:MAG: IS200/IS605 family transposase [Candidatus Peregrinibacteria bacterium]QQR55561.1 MAG: IS200/IS605 family transposase [Candidatus Peregrinibacteria bacterium]
MKKLRKSSHAVFICDYHLVWPTKYRRKIFNEGVLAFLQEVMKDIPKYYPELVVKEVNTDLDHVHILISIPPQIAVGEVVRIIKANTARELNIKFPFLRKVYWGREVFGRQVTLPPQLGLTRRSFESISNNRAKKMRAKRSLN